MILPHKGTEPIIPDSCFIAPSADIIGDVVMGEQSSAWFQVVIRGDVNLIRIGTRTNIQDAAVLHVTRRSHALHIGDDVTVGHRVTLHGCTLKNRILVGMGVVIMDGAVIDDDSIVAAGSLVTKGKVFPPKSLIQGSPAVRVRDLTVDEIAYLKQSAMNYVGDTELYNKEFEEIFQDCDDEGCEDEDCHDHGGHGGGKSV